jgi:hypothetical protein
MCTANAVAVIGPPELLEGYMMVPLFERRIPRLLALKGPVAVLPMHTLSFNTPQLRSSLH